MSDATTIPVTGPPAFKVSRGWPVAGSISHT